MIKRFYNPGVYHGRGKNNVFFEGWYYKLISADKTRRLAVIPGVFLHQDPLLSHAFIQVLDGISSGVVYHRFPVDDFRASRREFIFQVADSTFYQQGIQLNIAEKDQIIQGELRFDGIQPWPVRVFSPGVMGPYRFAPFMQTYHGILSLTHTIQGDLSVAGEKIDFTGGRGYIEKDWGRTFPRAYIWMQSNHFHEDGISLTASVATIPWLGSWFRGFLIGVLVGDKLFRFTTYLGSEIKQLIVDDEHVEWVTSGNRQSDPDGKFPGYCLTIRAKRGSTGLLKSPELDGMTPRIFESLTAELEISLAGMDQDGKVMEILYKGKGDCGGLEVAGSIDEILSQP